MRAGDRLDRIHIATEADLRTRLETNHARGESVWNVIPHEAAGGDRRARSDIVDEAFCFGWIDGLPRTLDATRTMLLLSPRKRGSAWARIDRDELARLIGDGRMREPGLRRSKRRRRTGATTGSRGSTISALAGPGGCGRTRRGGARRLRSLRAVVVIPREKTPATEVAGVPCRPGRWAWPGPSSPEFDQPRPRDGKAKSSVRALRNACSLKRRKREVLSREAK